MSEFKVKPVYQIVVALVVLIVFNISVTEAEIPADRVSAQASQSRSDNAGQDVASIDQKITIPDVSLIRQDGTKAKFPEELDDGKPVVLTFIYTSCKAACPIMSHIMKNVQNKLGERAKDIHMASISLDPEFDTPNRLAEYARKLGAGPQWIHYTGLNADIVKFERAFNIYRGDKMNHLTVIFARRSPNETWVKFVGFVNSNSIINVLGIATNGTH